MIKFETNKENHFFYRFSTFSNHANNKIINRHSFATNFRIVLLCVFLGLLAPTAPLLGWSKYSINISQVSCDIEWKDRSLNVVSYNIAIFFFVFFVPLTFIVGCNLGLIIIVSRCQSDTTLYHLLQ